MKWKNTTSCFIIDFKVLSLTAKNQNVLGTRTRACNTRTRSQPPELVLEDSQGNYSVLVLEG